MAYNRPFAFKLYVLLIVVGAVGTAASAAMVLTSNGAPWITAWTNQMAAPSILNDLGFGRTAGRDKVEPVKTGQRLTELPKAVDAAREAPRAAGVTPSVSTISFNLIERAQAAAPSVPSNRDTTGPYELPSATPTRPIPVLRSDDELGLAISPASKADPGFLLAANTPPGTGSSGPRGITDNEIRFGIVAPFSGPSRQLGTQMKLGIDAAFKLVNDAGGVNGRKLSLIAADDGYDPARTADAMAQLYDREQVFGVIGNVGTPTGAVALPYALSRQMLFFGGFSGANFLRNDPPDRYVFNYRASYAEETSAVVNYLVRTRRIRPDQIVVFAQQDAFGDAGFEGVTKAMRTMRVADAGPLARFGYKRNTVDVDEAVAGLRAYQLRRGGTGVRAVVMVATYRAAAKFIEKTREIQGLIYTNVSFVGSTALAEELMVLGPKYADGVIVTQVVPSVDGYSGVVIDYKNALAKASQGQTPDYVSFEGYLAAQILIEGLRNAGRDLDTEPLIQALEKLRDYDLGLGDRVNFSRNEHQAIHKVWGSQIDATGHFKPIDLQ